MRKSAGKRIKEDRQRNFALKIEELENNGCPRFRSFYGGEKALSIAAAKRKKGLQHF
jgi:hypothetical protein